MKYFCTYILVVSFAITLLGQDLEGYFVQVYKKADTVDLKLYIKYPPQWSQGSSFPAIIFFFGGGWNSGNVKQFQPHADYLSSLGMIAILADYRVRNRHRTTPFDAVADAKSAVRYIRENATTLKIDPVRIAAAGGSAGGHLAAATAVIPGLDEQSENLRVSSRPNALILFNPVFDNGPTGYGYERIGERYPEISPIHNIRSGVPPTIVFLGTEDNLIPVATAKLYKQKMEQWENRCELFLYEGQKHGFFNFRENSENDNKYFNETLAETRKFLESLGYL
jgi:acetyl esterase